jgi:RNA polymerase sigma factor (sigma-70 family)
MAASPRRGPGSPAGGRKLSVAEARFYAAVFSSARKGSLNMLCRKGCGAEEAEEIFTAAFERVMERVDPIAREFSEAQMVSYIKRACWLRLIDERRRRGLRAEVGLGAIRSLRDSSTPSPEEIAEAHEAAAIGREALQMLSERDRLIFRQRHQMNLSPEEITRNTPGLSLRSYRKIIQRANARVLDAFERIQGGERCEEMRASLLRRYVTEESREAERRAVEAHLAHCRACQQAQAQMRGYLVDVAGGVLVASTLAEPSHSTAMGDVAANLLQLASHAAQALGEAGRGARERVREALLRAATRLPGSGADASAGQALNASSVKVASICASLAAGACLTAGVVPGVGGIGLSANQSHAKELPAKRAPHLTPPSAQPTLIDTLPRPHEVAPADSKERNPSTYEPAKEAKRQATEPSTAQPASPVSNSPSDARGSGRQTGTEFGVESRGQSQPVSPTQAPSNSGGATVQSGRITSSENHGEESGSEFGM